MIMMMKMMMMMMMIEAQNCDAKSRVYKFCSAKTKQRRLFKSKWIPYHTRRTIANRIFGKHNVLSEDFSALSKLI
jgi:hypothetical protein